MGELLGRALAEVLVGLCREDFWEGFYEFPSGSTLGELFGTRRTLVEPGVFGAAFFRPTALR